MGSMVEVDEEREFDVTPKPLDPGVAMEAISATSAKPRDNILQRSLSDSSFRKS